MNLYNVLLNNKIPFILSESNTSENIIYCNSFNDYLFNVGVFKTRDKEVVLEYIVVNEEKYAQLDITFEGGECYKNVEFKIIITDKKVIPYSTFNKNNLGSNKTIIEKAKEEKMDLVEEEKLLPTNIDIISKEQLEELEKKKTQYEQATLKALEEEKRLVELKKELRKEKIILEKTEIIKSKLAEYKKDLLNEYLLITNKQKEFLDNKFNNKFDDVIKDLNEKVANTFEKYESYLKDTDEVNKEHQLNLIVSKLDESIKNLKENILTVADNDKKTFYKKIEKDSIIALTEQASLLENRYKDKLILELESYKYKLLETIKEVSEFKVDQLLTKRKIDIELSLLKTFEEQRKQFKKDVFDKSKTITEDLNKLVSEFSKKVPSITKNISQLEEKVRRLSVSEEKSKREFSREQTSIIDKIARKWALKILDLAGGGGGGSVAQQFAGGGTILGDLNICGDIIPCQDDTFSIGTSALRFKDLYLTDSSLYIGDAKITAVGSTIVFPENQNTIGNLNVTEGSILSAGVNLLDIFVGGGGGGIVPKYESTYNTVQANSANWDYAYSQINVTTSIINYLSGQIDQNVFQNVNSSYDTIAEFVSNPHPTVYKGYTVTLVNKRVYVLAGNDQNNYNHYIELNANPITPIYIEEALSASGVIIDLYSLTDFRSAKYTIQVQTNFNNDIYFSEINTVGAVGSMQSVAVEYGQNYTDQLIDSYTTFIQGGKLYLSANFVNNYNDPAKKYIFKGLRTNLYKI